MIGRDPGLLAAVVIGVVGVVVGGGCSSSPGPASAPSLSVVAEHPAWVVGASSSCAADACTLTFRVMARGGFHANAEYPHRFVADVGNVVVDDAARVVAVDGDVIALTERARPPADGVVRGRLFMSVCSDEQCLIEKVPVALTPSP